MDFEALKQECLVCRRCGLCETRTNVVFGMGSPTAEVMFIGEGPGRNEDEQGLPFVGRSGKLLDQYLEAVDLSRDKNVFIGNIVKCRPPENRDPLPEEWDACLPPQNRGVPWPDRRPAAHPPGFFGDQRTRPVRRKKRRAVHRYPAPRRAAAQPHPKAPGLCRLRGPARKDFGSLRSHLLTFF